MSQTELRCITEEDYTIAIMNDLEVVVDITGSDTVDQLGLSKIGVLWSQHPWGYTVQPDNDQELQEVLNLLSPNECELHSHSLICRD